MLWPASTMLCQLGTLPFTFGEGLLCLDFHGIEDLGHGLLAYDTM
jgi:hypothetical protein